MDIIYRQISEDDYSFVRQMLYEALFVPEGEKPFPKNIIDLPEIFWIGIYNEKAFVTSLPSIKIWIVKIIADQM